LSLLSVPVCLASRATVRAALAVALAFASVFASATLGVRVVTVGARGGQHDARAARFLAFVVTTGSLAALTWAGAARQLPWVALLAAAPGLLVAAAISAWPPRPSRLRTLGWALVVTSSVTALVLIAGLDGRHSQSAIFSVPAPDLHAEYAGATGLRLPT